MKAKRTLLHGMFMSFVLLCTCSEPEKPKPEITSLVPAEEEVGAEVVIQGKNFATATAISFGSVKGNIVQKTDTEILTVVPAGLAAGKVKISVTADGGTSNEKEFNVLPTIPVDPLTQPVIAEIVASKNITGQLMLVRGTNLSTATKIKFGAVEADIVTATSKVVTAIIPASLAVGNYSVVVKSTKGNSETKPFEVVAKQPDPPAGVTLVNGATVTSIPAGYVPPVSNQWDNGSEKILLNDETDGKLSAKVGNDDFPSSPNGFYDKANNYVEFTVRGIRYVGVWNPSTDYNASNDDCFHNMVLISTQSGKQLKLKVRAGNCK